MRFTIIALAALAVVYANKESNTCCGYREEHINVGQLSAQYMEQNRYPFQPFKPIIPKYPDEPTDAGSIVMPQTISTTSSVTETPALLRIINGTTDQYKHQYENQTEPFGKVGPLLKVYMAPFNVAAISAASSASDTVTPVQLNAKKAPNYAAQEGYAQFAQYSTQYSDQTRIPFQPYKPFVPKIIAKTDQYQRPYQSVQLNAGKTVNKPASPMFTNRYNQFSSQYTEPSPSPYMPYKPFVPSTKDPSTILNPTPTVFPDFSASSVSYSPQDLIPYRSDEHIIPAPYQTDDPVPVGSPDSSLTPKVQPVQPPPAISVSIVSNGRTIFDDYITRNDTTPLIKIIINNVYNYNTA